jgi:hypothetical protein
MALLVLQFLYVDSFVFKFFYGDSGAQIFSVELWLLHDTYLLRFFHDASCVPVARWFFLFLLFFYGAPPCL